MGKEARMTDTDTTVTKRTAEQWTAIGAAIALFIGALLPWATIATPFGIASKAGIEGDGFITLGLGLVGALASWQAGRWLIATILAGALVVLITIIDYADISGGDPDISVGSGLIMSLVAGVVLGAAGATQWDKQRREPTTPTATDNDRKG